jgi:hypothetical protein
MAKGQVRDISGLLTFRILSVPDAKARLMRTADPLARDHVDGATPHGDRRLAGRPRVAAAAVVLVVFFLTGCLGSGSDNTPGEKSEQNVQGQAKTPFPQGTFVTVLTAQDFDRAGVPRPNAPLPATQTTTIRGRRWREVETPRAPDTSGGGRLVVRGDQVTFITENPPGAVPFRVRDVLRWSYFRGLLTFRIIGVLDGGARVSYTAHPWRKIK